jgi:PTS system N-acetylgalactosamine-specific IIA component
MINIIVMGHGGYAEGVKGNIEMLSGIPNNIHFIDLGKDGGLPQLEMDLDQLLVEIGDSEILYVCDLLGASPFRVAAMKCIENPIKQALVTGLNTLALVELSIYDENISLIEMAERAINTTKESVSRFIVPIF